MTKRKLHLPLGLLAAGLLGVLAVMGVVSGLWSKNLVIHGEVTTGDLNVDWTTASSNDEFGPDSCTTFGRPDCVGLVRKDVGSLGCDIDKDDHQIIHFTIANGYPSYEADCEVHLTNTGSIPFLITGFAIDTAHSNPPLTNCAPVGPTDPDALVILCDQLKIGFIDGVGQQIDPGHQTASSVIVHVEQGAAQNHCTGTSSFFPVLVGPLKPGFVVVSPDCDPANNPNLVSYEFTIKECVAQWNEKADYKQCVLSEQHEGPVFAP